jgi:WD40-like Beta Propeller Repeat
MTLSNSFRLAGLLVAAFLCAASASSGGKTGGGASRTEKTGVFYTTKPRFEWPHRKGSNYRVVLWRIPTVAGQQRIAVYDQLNYTERFWIPADNLDFQTRYELFVYNDAMQIVTSWGFTIGFQPPQVIFPEPNAKVRNLSPEIRIAPFDYPWVYYGFEIAESAAFDKVVDTGYVSHQDNVKVFAGPDNELGTSDDIRFVGWPVSKVLKPNKTYYWRVRGYYFDEGDFANKGTVPSKESAGGKSEATGSFTIPPQSGSDSLANVTQITRDSANTGQPTLSKRLDLAYISINPDGGSEIRVAGVQVQKGVPIFDTGREEFTKSVKGSTDQWPAWDVDGEGLFFASDRSSGTPNIWYKRRDARGYTQLTFHDRTAWGPTISKDGNRVAYQVKNNENSAGWSIWIVGRDGRSATELGAGEQPKFSPDGKKLAFSQVDFNGVKQIWVMDTNGGNRVQITNEACPRFNCTGNQTPIWHPQGNRLVFVSDTKSENHDIWMVELDGARMVQLTNYLGADVTPEFTPDGRYLMFASQRGGDTFHIWMGEFAAN